MTIHLIGRERRRTRCGLDASLVTTLALMPTYPPYVDKLCPECVDPSQIKTGNLMFDLDDKFVSYTEARTAVLVAASSPLSDGSYANCWRVSEELNAFSTACHGRVRYSTEKPAFVVARAREHMRNTYDLHIIGEVEPEAE